MHSRVASRRYRHCNSQEKEHKWYDKAWGGNEEEDGHKEVCKLADIIRRNVPNAWLAPEIQEWAVNGSSTAVTGILFSSLCVCAHVCIV